MEAHEQETGSSWRSRFLFQCLVSGLVIFKGKENRVCRRNGGVPCVPCFIFPKVSWSVSNRSFPVPTVLPVWMTGVSSAASSTSSSTDFSERMHLMSTARTKRCAIALSGGAGSVFSTKIFTELANKTSFDGSLMIDSTHLKAHRTAARLLKKGILHVL